MSGHSKWATTKHKKAVIDAKRGKLFARLVKNIEVSARNGGGDPAANPTLYDAIQKAKKNSVPADNIDRALKRGSGAESGGADWQSIMYEGYGPGGVALLIEYMAPVALVLLAWVRTRHAPSRLVLSGTLAAVLGLLCVLDLTGATPDALGVLFGFGAMIGAAAYFVLSARPTTLPPIALAAFGLAAGAVVLGLALLVGLLPYSVAFVPVQLLGLSVAWWVPLGVVVVSATALAYALGVAGISLMGERLASFVSLSEVLFAALLAAVVLGEVPSAIQILGGVLIIFGVLLIRFASGRAPAGLPTLPDELEAAESGH